MDGDKMKVTKEDLQNVAVLSRLSIPAEQEEKYLGQLDEFLTYVENLAAIEEALKIAKNKDYSIIKVPKANHLFQIIENGNTKDYNSMVKEYLETEQTFAPEVLKVIGDWILLKYQVNKGGN